MPAMRKIDLTELTVADRPELEYVQFWIEQNTREAYICYVI